MSKPDTRAVRNFRARDKYRRDNLLNPRASTRERDKLFPVFKPGMTTARYVQLFQDLNLDLRRAKFTYANRAAPMLDPSTPEVEHEVLP